MSSGYDELLQRASTELTREEQLQFVLELSKRAAANGANRSGSLYDALTKRGIIGSITDAPADLGTNPEYMEGFGQHG